MTYTRLNPADSGWHTLTLASGWTAYAASQTPKYRKVGNVVEVVGTLKPTEQIAASGAVIGTLPKGCKPQIAQYTLHQGSGMNRWLLLADTNGNLSVSRYGTTAETAIPSGTWMPFSVTFLA